MSIVIRRVDDKVLRHRWARLPEHIYLDEPGYIPALRSATLAAMNPRQNPFHRHAHIAHFLASIRDRDVGRIATTVHPDYNERHGCRRGFFGFLDSVDTLV